MKKSLLHLLIFSLILELSACGGDNSDSPGPPTNDKIEVSQSSMLTAADSESLVLTGTASTDWVAMSDVSWVALDPTKGVAGSFKINVTVLENKTTSHRSGNIIVKSGKAEKRVKIQQQGFEPAPALNVSLDESVEIGHDARSVKFDVQSSSKWKGETSARWLSINPSSADGDKSAITLSVAANRSERSREATLAISNDDNLSWTAAIRQLGLGETIITAEDTDLGPDKGAFKVTINTDDEYVATIPQSDDWIKLIDKDTDKGVMEFEYSVNKSTELRKATITVGTIYKTIDVTVTQAGASGGGDINDMPIIPLN